MVVNNQQMQMEEDRPVSIGEMDFEFITKKINLGPMETFKVCNR